MANWINRNTGEVRDFGQVRPDIVGERIELWRRTGRLVRAPNRGPEAARQPQPQAQPNVDPPGWEGGRDVPLAPPVIRDPGPVFHWNPNRIVEVPGADQEAVRIPPIGAAQEEAQPAEETAAERRNRQSAEEHNRLLRVVRQRDAERRAGGAGTGQERRTAPVDGILLEDEVDVDEDLPGEVFTTLQMTAAINRREFAPDGGHWIRTTDGAPFFQRGDNWVIDRTRDRRMTKELDVSKIPEYRGKLPPFKLEYQNLEEAALRLQDSIIRMRSQPFLVTNIETAGRREYRLYLHDARKKSSHILYSHPDVDLRSISPGYVHGGPLVSYLARQPTRVYKQGLTINTGVHKPIGSTQWRGFDGHYVIMKALEGRKLHKWDEKIAAHVEEGLIHGIYLSDNLGVVRKDGKSLVEYKGRILGDITEDTVRLDEDDFEQSWIKADLKDVGLTARQ